MLCGHANGRQSVLDGTDDEMCADRKCVSQSECCMVASWLSWAGSRTWVFPKDSWKIDGELLCWFSSMVGLDRWFGCGDLLIF